MLPGKGWERGKVGLSGLGIELTGITGAKGEFRFKDLKPRTFSVSAKKGGLSHSSRYTRAKR